MSGPPDSAQEALRWLEKASHDLLNARHTLTLQENCPLDTVCFHAQQCAEKSLRGLLIGQSLHFPLTHDLIVLHNLLPESAREGIRAEDLRILNRYAVEARYPGNWEPISRQESSEATAMAGRIYECVSKLIA